MPRPMLMIGILALLSFCYSCYNLYQAHVLAVEIGVNAIADSQLPPDDPGSGEHGAPQSDTTSHSLFPRKALQERLDDARADGFEMAGLGVLLVVVIVVSIIGERRSGPPESWTAEYRERNQRTRKRMAMIMAPIIIAGGLLLIGISVWMFYGFVSFVWVVETEAIAGEPTFLEAIIEHEDAWMIWALVCSPLVPLGFGLLKVYWGWGLIKLLRSGHFDRDEHAAGVPS